MEEVGPSITEMDMAQKDIQILLQACLKSLHHSGLAHEDLALRHFRKHQDGSLRLFDFSHMCEKFMLYRVLQCEEQEWVQ